MTVPKEMLDTYQSVISVNAHKRFEKDGHSNTVSDEVSYTINIFIKIGTVGIKTNILKLDFWMVFKFPFSGLQWEEFKAFVSLAYIRIQNYE